MSRLEQRNHFQRRRAFRRVANPGFWVILLATAGLAAPARPARSEVIVDVAKNTLYGAATGLVLGGATSLVVNKGHKNDAVKWGVVLGTFGGFLYGVYDVSRGDYALLPPSNVEPPDPLVAAWGNERWPDLHLTAAAPQP